MFRNVYRLDNRHSGTPPGINSSRNPVQQMIRLQACPVLRYGGGLCSLGSDCSYSLTAFPPSMVVIPGLGFGLENMFPAFSPEYVLYSSCVALPTTHPTRGYRGHVVEPGMTNSSNQFTCRKSYLALDTMPGHFS